jgi:hypothetical protein
MNIQRIKKEHPPVEADGFPGIPPFELPGGKIHCLP